MLPDRLVTSQHVERGHQNTVCHRDDRALLPALGRNPLGYLRKIARLDLTMEFYVVMVKYRPLFSDDEREIARWRLAYGAEAARQSRSRIASAPTNPQNRTSKSAV